MTTKTDSELTLRDRLSRLTYEQACKLLGAEGRRLIQAAASTTSNSMPTCFWETTCFA